MSTPGPPPTWQFACAAYIPLLTANLSVIGSALIIWSVLAKERRHRKPQHRLLLMMSAYDLQYSLAKALTFLLAPRGYGVPGALGNMSTCRLQGFCIELAHATGGYNACLSLYYYLVICRGVKTEAFARRVEPAMHVLVSAVFWAFAIAGVAIELFNPAFGFCFIASYPPGCGTPGGPPCDRFPPEMMGLLYELFAQMWVQAYFVVIIFTQIAIWRKVRRQERATRQYILALEERRMQANAGAENSEINCGGDSGAPASSAPSSQRLDVCRRRAKTRREQAVATQSALYCSAFVVCWLGPTCFHLADWIGGYKAFWAVLIIVIFTPLQGFWNAFVYVRPTYLRLRRRHRELTRWQCVRCALLGTKGVAVLLSGQQPGTADEFDPDECEKRCIDEDDASSEREYPKRRESDRKKRWSSISDAIAKVAEIGAAMGDLGEDSDLDLDDEEKSGDSWSSDT